MSFQDTVRPIFFYLYLRNITVKLAWPDTALWSFPWKKTFLKFLKINIHFLLIFNPFLIHYQHSLAQNNPISALWDNFFWGNIYQLCIKGGGGEIPWGGVSRDLFQIKKSQLFWETLKRASNLLGITNLGDFSSRWID